MTKRVYRTDISTLRPVERRPDGTIRVDAFLSKCGVFQYMQPDGSIRRELRLPEDVFDAESLRSFEGVPMTNNHPPGMIDAKNATKYMVGAAQGAPVPDGDHMRGRLAVYDHDTVKAMDSGKLQVSNGYTCDCLEQPGMHPEYGPYDAIQKNIRGNHIALVDRARAGVTAMARMDADCANGMMVLPEGEEVTFDMPLALEITSCKSHAMAQLPTARVEVVVKHDEAQPSATVKVDPEDLANRNAAGETKAKKAPKEQPGESYEDDGNDRAKPRKGKPMPDDDDDGDDDDRDDDAMYDEDGKLTDFGKKKVASASFAVPDKQQLAIHSPEAVKDSMKRFAKHEFNDDDAKHGAFNRIKGKALQFGMKDDAARFESKHAGKLDRADYAHKDNAMSIDIKALEEKAAKRKEKLVAARARIDALETEKATLESKVQNLTKELDTAKAAPRADATDETKIAERVESKVALLETARATGAKVDAKMSDRAIKCAVIKHVDNDDVSADKHDAYVDGVYEGALKRAKNDTDATNRGAQALAATRQAIAGGAATHADAADDTDEDAAKARLRSASSTAWMARKEN